MTYVNKELGGFGLTELPDDHRDVQLGQIVPLRKDLPDNFLLPERAVKNQDSLLQGSDFCTAYASCLPSEYQENIKCTI